MSPRDGLVIQCVRERERRKRHRRRHGSPTLSTPYNFQRNPGEASSKPSQSTGRRELQQSNCRGASESGVRERDRDRVRVCMCLWIDRVSKGVIFLFLWGSSCFLSFALSCPTWDTGGQVSLGPPRHLSPCQRSMSAVHLRLWCCCVGLLFGSLFMFSNFYATEICVALANLQ